MPPTPAPLRMRAKASTGAGRKGMLAGRRKRAIPALMPDERAILALSRIERALARIEAAAGRAPPAPAGNGELEQLREAHQALRGRVEGAISHIDQLLADRQGAG